MPRSSVSKDIAYFNMITAIFVSKIVVHHLSIDQLGGDRLDLLTANWLPRDRR